MSSLHTIVEPNRTLQAPGHFVIKQPSFNSNNEFHTSYKPNIHNDIEEEDVDILDDDEDDEDDLEDDDDDDNDLDDNFPTFQLPRPTPTHLPPPSNNYLSINHIISPNNSQPQQIHALKKVEPQNNTIPPPPPPHHNQDTRNDTHHTPAVPQPPPPLPQQPQPQPHQGKPSLAIPNFFIF
jgi:hypothetical protein